MPPTRTKNSQHRQQANDGEHHAGLQKLKASLRQTKRLLAKENLNASMKVTAERQLESLNKQIEQAELSRRERDYATKYRMVKFFDKKKVCRRISQLLKQLASVSSQERSKLEEELSEKRVELNYINHYPKLEKYISLFPHSEDKGAPTDSKGKHKAEQSATDKRRDELKAQVRQAMSNGEMSNEPELKEAEMSNNNKEDESHSGKGRSSKRHEITSRRDKSEPASPPRNVHRESRRKGGPNSKSEQKTKAATNVQPVEEDDFFGGD